MPTMLRGFLRFHASKVSLMEGGFPLVCFSAIAATTIHGHM
jgi:hypothetical protein